jgi:hypothetical protein
MSDEYNPATTLPALPKEAWVLALMMRAAVDVVGREAAHDIWHEAAELSLEYNGFCRTAWCDAREPFDNHPDNAIDE